MVLKEDSDSLAKVRQSIVDFIEDNVSFTEPSHVNVTLEFAKYICHCSV